MKTDFWLDCFPIWSVFIFTLAVALISMQIGIFLGIRKKRRSANENDAQLGTIIAATLGLLGFLLVFTFGIAADRLQMRMQLLLDEINAIGTTYLRAGLLPDPHNVEIRKLLREYVNLRLDLAKQKTSKKEKLQQFTKRSEELQDQMWQHAQAIVMADRTSPIDALFIDSLNKMIDLQTSRLTVFTYRIPPPIWNVLYIISILSMLLVGYQLGISGKSGFNFGFILASTFSMLILLIADLDRVAEGTLQVSQKPMIELQMKLSSDVNEYGVQK
jgi:hypothetical protein